MRFVPACPRRGQAGAYQLAPMPELGVSPLSQLWPKPRRCPAREHRDSRPGGLHGARAESPLTAISEEASASCSRRCRSGGFAPAADRSRRGRGKILVGQTTRRSATSRSTWTRSPKPFAPGTCSSRTSGSRRPRSFPKRWSTARSGIACAWASIERRAEADRLLNSVADYPVPGSPSG